MIPELNDIGAALVEAAKASEPSPQQALQKLFPYVFEASRLMSTHAISRWLKENHKIQISQPTISRALRNPDKYWQGFAEFIEPAARHVERYMDAGLDEFLFKDDLFDVLVERMDILKADTKESSDLQDAVDFLRAKWFSLSLDTREYCQRFFSESESE